MASHSTNQSKITYVSSYFKYNVNYDGKTIETIVTNQAFVADEWVNGVLLVYANNPKVVLGLDFKWNVNGTTSFKRSDKCATLQLCIDTKCLILQLLHMEEIPQSLKSFFMNPKLTFMGVDENLSKVVSEYGLDFYKTEDLRAAVVNKWPRRFQQHDMGNLANQILGLDIMKLNSRVYNWEGRVLLENLVENACSVAYVLYKIGHKLYLEN